MKFTVSPMTCGSCVRTITLAIQSIDPRAEVVVDLDRRTVGVAGMLVAAQAVEALAAAGFHAEPAGETTPSSPAGCCGTCHA